MVTRLRAVTERARSVGVGDWLSAHSSKCLCCFEIKTVGAWPTKQHELWM
jgi:hypothetical protein